MKEGKGYSIVQEQETDDALSQWIRNLVEHWLNGAYVWHFEEMPEDARAHLSRCTIGMWFALADTMSTGCTRGLLVSYHGDDHLEVNAFVVWQMKSRTNLRVMECFSDLLNDLIVRGNHCVAPLEIQYCVPAPTVLILWALLFARYWKHG